MKAQTARLIGGAGTGKTSALMDIIELLINAGIDPLRIGFASFTRAARLEAVDRMSLKFGLDRDRILDYGWFKTVHSIAYKMLRPNRLLTGVKADQEWMEAIFGKEAHFPSRPEDGMIGELSEAGSVLQLWGAYRLSMGYMKSTDIPLHGGIDWDRMASFPDWLSGMDMDIHVSDAVAIVDRYEQHCNMDNIDDYTSLVARYAGVKFRPSYPPAETYAEGDLPDVDTWLFDEQQDTSPLLDIACRRLASAPEVRYVYLAGDPFQSIFQWAGSSSRCFMGWDVTEGKQRVMPQSYRCPLEILDLGEKILQQCSDYWDRRIAPAPHDGTVELKRTGLMSILSSVNPDDQWLVLARTVRESSTILHRLRQRYPDHHIGWASRDQEHHGRPRRAAMALWKLRHSQGINPDEWADIVHTVPVGLGLIQKGMRKKMDDRDAIGCIDIYRLQGVEADPFSIDSLKTSLQHPGHTDELCPALLADDWFSNFGEKLTLDLSKLHHKGSKVFDKPQVRVGTIHSSKGMEADNVAWLATETRAIQNNCKDNPESADEERRVQYVAATRAKKRLVIALPPSGRAPKLPI